MKKFIKKIIVLFLITVSFTPMYTHAVSCRPSYDDDSYCRELGYKLVGGDGCHAGNCLFPDGSSCFSTDFYEGSCGKKFRKEVACSKNGEHVPSYKQCCDGEKISHVGPGGFASWTTCEAPLIYYSTKTVRAWPLIVFGVLLFGIPFVVYVVIKKKKNKNISDDISYPKQ